MSRKKLSENEDSFIKGTPTPASKPAAKSKPTEPNQADRLKQILEPTMPAPKDPTIRFTADLPVDLHRRLTLAAARAGKSKVDIVREVLEEILPVEQ